MARLDDNPRRMLGQIFHFSSTTLVSSLITLFQGIIALKLVEPSVYGVWSSVALILDYGIFLHLGLIHGMERAIPYFRGMNKDDEAHKIAETVKFSLLILIIAGTIITLGIASGVGHAWRMEIRIGIASVIAASLLFLGTQYYIALMKVSQRFKQVGYVQLVQAIAMLACLVLIWRWKYYGFCMRAIIASALGLCVAAGMARDANRAKFDWKTTRYLIKTGVPLMFISALCIVLFSFDRLIILGFLGTTMVGYYGICMALLRMVNLFQTVVGHVYAPVMANTYGATHSPSSLLPYALKSSLMSFLMTLAASMVLYFFIPFFVIRFLPKYSYGITAARISLITGLFISLMVGPSWFLQTIMRQMEQFIVMALTSVAMISVSIIFLARGYELTGVAWGFAAGYALNLAGLWIYIFVFCRREKISGLSKHNETNSE